MYAPDSLSTTLLLYFTIYLHSSTQQAEISVLANTYGSASPEILNRFNWDAGSYAALQDAFRAAEQNVRCIMFDLPPTPVCTFCMYYTVTWDVDMLLLSATVASRPASFTVDISSCWQECHACSSCSAACFCTCLPGQPHLRGSVWTV